MFGPRASSSPSAAMRISSVGTGRPTVPIFISTSVLIVPAAHVSVIPHASSTHDPAGVEELEHLAADRRGGGDRQLQPAAEQVAHLREHEPVGDPVLRRPAMRPGAAPAALELADAVSDAERPVERAFA